MSGRLKVGLAGAGLISAHHLVAWKQRPDVEVVAICDPDLTRARDRAAAFSIPAVYADAATMLDEIPLDALDVASPRETHAPIIRLAAARGVAVLCQKPLAPTLAEAERLVTGVAGKAPLMVHENWRFRPWYRSAGSWIAAGRLGRLRSATMRVRSSGLLQASGGQYPALQRQPFMASLERCYVAESLIHQIDVMRWLVGPLHLRWASIARSCPVIIGEDRATVVMATEAGAPVVVDGDAAAPGYPPRSSDELEIVGGRATLRLEGARLSLSGEHEETATFDLAAGYQASFDAAIGHFADALRTGAPFETGAHDNLATLRLVEEVYASYGRTGLSMPDPTRRQEH